MLCACTTFENDEQSFQFTSQNREQRFHGRAFFFGTPCHEQTNFGLARLPALLNSMEAGSVCGTNTAFKIAGYCLASNHGFQI
jgi:hypothetical protein